MERLHNEELEGELVRYKLLYAEGSLLDLCPLALMIASSLRYAEAMHENEDAQASRRLSTNTTFSSHSSRSQTLSPR
jgi:hypothetical protein